MDQVQHALETAEELLLDCFLGKKPVVLFLGQDAFVGEELYDPMLKAVAAQLDYADAEAHGWAALLVGRRLADDQLRWLTERFERNVLSDVTSAVLNAPWSAIFTTSIDPTLRGRIEASGRQPELIACAEWFPSVARSRSRPPINHLFGLSNGTSPQERAPRDAPELKRRRNTQALPLAGRMVESATQLGLIVIDGFTPGRDWLDPDDLFSVLPSESAPQIIWFGATPDWVPEAAAELASRGALILEPRRLGEVLLALQADGRFDSASLPAASEPGVLRLEGDRAFVIEPGLRLRVEASAAIVEDDWYTLPLAHALSDNDAFERFHGDLLSPRGLVEGVARGFAIERECEATLRSRIADALRRQDDVNRIVLFHGQSATGKSIALARLALALRRDERLPVLYARNRMPQVQDLIAFTELAEAAGASATVILADANQRPERYRDVAAGLRAKGRRVVVVGTSYRQEIKRKKARDFVEAPATLTKDERDALRRLLETFGGGALPAATARAISEEEHALAWLYRHLSSSRETIASGIAREARATEEMIRFRARETRRLRIRSQLAEQLIAAGLHGGQLPLLEQDGGFDEFGGDAAGRLVDLVMVAGRLGASVPLNLLLRVLGNSHRLELVDVGRLFEELDIFRWEYADAQQSELKVSPRVRLEADLICRRRLPDVRSEINRLLDLIGGVRSKGLERRIEIDFLRDLLQLLDKDGPRGEAYAPGYLDFARVLTELRVRHQVLDASLMLQESAFRRAALRFHDYARRTDLDVQMRAKILDEARAVVEEALTSIANGQLRAAARTKENLQVERASIYGFLAVGRAKAREASDEVWSDYLAARTASRAAMGSMDSYFPLDVALWTTADVLLETRTNGSALSDARRAELVADLHEVLDHIDVGSLSPEQKVRFHKQRAKVARALDDNAMAEDALTSLEELNPPAAIFLRTRARATAALALTDGIASTSAREQAAAAAIFLEERLSDIVDDTRCLELLLTLKWISATGRRPMRGVRQPLPRSLSTRSDVSSLIDRLIEAAGVNARFPLRHLQATMRWVAGDFRRAEDLWRSLSRDAEAEDSTRTIRRHFISDPSGAPLWFRGRVIEQRTKGHWRLSVEGFEGRVGLLEDEFRGEEIAIGRELRRFAIAFNYIGPIADPVSRYGGER